VDLSRYAALFLADARDHLRRCNARLLEWEERPASTEPVDELFRAFHSLKSSALTMGYQDVGRVAHSAEHLLESVRRGELAPSKAVVGLMFQAVDLLDRGVEGAVRGEALTDAQALTEAIDRLAQSATPSTLRDAALSAAPAAVASPAPAVDRRAGRARVDPARLDELLQQAGELVVARNRLTEVVQTRADPELEVVAGRIDSLTRTLHAGVLRVRLAPITELFGRFPRIVRDLAQSLGKVARLEIKAEGIELDRSVLEELVDPLLHLIRNAIDHGIEPAAVRMAAGKNSEGRLVLAAERHRDQVVIRLTDDGRGIDPAQVAARAVEVGLLAAGSTVAAADLMSLLARPGFTLKREVTEVSGRGVGMDVVVTRLRSIGGTVDLTTAPGRGAEFSLTVPLTTAVQRVLLVTSAGQRFAVPFRLVREATFPGADEEAGMVTSAGFSFRGQRLPYLHLGTLVGATATATVATRHPVLMIEWGERVAALGVDGLLGQHDILLERIEAPTALPAWVSGATILGDGAPAFVVDPTAWF
jgi:two-component system chemotaxis sensor kinase CheA